MKFLTRLKSFLKRGETQRKKAHVETIQIKEVMIKTDIPRIAEIARETARKMREKKIKERFLPEPTTRRRLIVHREHIPAVQHDLSKHFKGKGSKHQHRTYRASVKAHKKINEKD